MCGRLPPRVHAPHVHAHVLEAATARARGCNPSCWRLQPYVSQVRGLPDLKMLGLLPLPLTLALTLTLTLTRCVGCPT